MNNYPSCVKIVEVGPRDGLQNEKQPIDVATKLTLVDQLIEAGVKNIEAGSFVNPTWVPQMAGSDELFKVINQQYSEDKSLNFTALTPNTKGLERAIESGVKEVAIFAAATESFSQKNINCSIDESLKRFKDVTSIALKNNLRVRGYISCVTGCPYEGAVNYEVVKRISKNLLNMGCYEISLGDTIGVATAKDIQELLRVVSKTVPVEKIALHLHDTYGQAIANIVAGLTMGIAVFDSSVGGLGGCPYARGASGNVATEDVIYLLNGLGIKHGIDIDKLIVAGKTICNAIHKPYSVKSGSALLAKKALT